MKKLLVVLTTALASFTGFATARTFYVDTVWSSLGLYPSQSIAASISAGVPDLVGPASVGGSVSFHLGSWQSVSLGVYAEYPFLATDTGSAFARAKLGFGYYSNSRGADNWVNTSLSVGYEFRPAFAGNVSLVSRLDLYYYLGASRPGLGVSVGPRFYLDME